MTTREVAALLRVRERRVYDLAAAGGIPHRRLTGKLLFPRVEIERWLGGVGPRPPGPAVIAGSHDPLLDWALRESGSGLASMLDGSLDGLDRLAAGAACAAGLHVFDPLTARWNIPAVERRLADAPCVLIGWALRRRGLILGPAAAEATALADLRGLRLARRQPQAGAALWLDHALTAEGMAEAVTFTEAVARTETEAAAMVAQGEADACAGLEAVARPFGLRFAPLVDEAFDLAIDRRAYFEPPLQALMAFARGPAMAAKAAALGGYDLSALGAVRWIGA